METCETYREIALSQLSKEELRMSDQRTKRHRRVRNRGAGVAPMGGCGGSGWAAHGA